MNSHIIPVGPQETINGGTVTKKALLIFAETDLVVASIVYEFQANPPHVNVATAFTLGAGRYLSNVKSITFTGLATFIYRDHVV